MQPHLPPPATPCAVPGQQSAVPGQQSEVPLYVLYYLSRCPTSTHLRKQIKAYDLPRIHCQSVARLPERPAWLTGVPILANTTDGLLFKGSEAVRLLNELTRAHLEHQRQSAHAPPPLHASLHASLDAPTPDADTLSVAFGGDPESDGGEGLPDPIDDRKRAHSEDIDEQVQALLRQRKQAAAKHPVA